MANQKEQVLAIITQAINIAVGTGAFKNTKDVAVVNSALEFLENDYGSSEDELPQDSEPKAEAKVKKA